MTTTVGVLSEATPGERRVALVPASVGRVATHGATVVVQAGAGAGSFFSDEDYRQAGAGVAPSAAEALRAAAIVAKVRPPTAAEVGLLRPGQVVVGLLEPARDPGRVAALAASGVTSFALELLPRITRAQSMDVLTSQAAIAGYKAALMAAAALPRFFPMLTTPAGTIRPAKVLVLGAGVAGLQAIATARRLGAIVEAYDVRPATREQVQSLGGALHRARHRRRGRRRLRARAHRQERERTGGADRRAHRRGRRRDHHGGRPRAPAPLLITAAVVDRMKPGAVIVDLAAEGGGNCELTRPGETVERHGVTVLGPLDVAGLLPVHASDTVRPQRLQLPRPAGPRRRAHARTGTTRSSPAALLTRDGASSTRPTRRARRGGFMISGWSRPLHLPAGRVHRLRGHRRACPVILHTPLMSRLQLRARHRRWSAPWSRSAGAHDRRAWSIGVHRRAARHANAVGGYAVTERMLEMFKSSRERGDAQPATGPERRLAGARARPAGRRRRRRPERRRRTVLTEAAMVVDVIQASYFAAAVLFIPACAA